MSVNPTRSAPPAEALHRALALLKAGRFDEGEAQLRTILAQHPSEPDALQLLGLARKSRGRPDEAEALFRQSLKARPHQPAVLNNLGNVLKDQRRYAEAEPMYREAVRLQPGYGDAWFNLGNLLIAADRPADALAPLERARQLTPDNAKVLNAYGICLKALDRHDEALAAQRRAVALAPKSIEALHNCGSLLREAGHPDEAVDLLSRAVSLAPQRADLIYALGCACFDAGRFEESERALRTALGVRPEEPNYHRTLRQLYFVTGRPDRAADSFRAVLAERPDLAGLWADYAETLMQLGQREAALAAAQDGLARCGETVPLMHAQGDILTRLDRFDEAYDSFTRAIAHAAEPPSGLITGFARLLIRQGAFQEAERHLGDLVARAPENQLAWAYRELAWRLAGDARADWLVDYETFVRPLDIPVPKGFSSARDFNRALADALEPLHTTTVHPIDQTLRGGTQTFGALFRLEIPLVQALRRSIETAAADYVAGLPDDPEHPFLKRKSQTLRFAGSWSCRLRSAGYHTNHMHPEGWVSSAYYVALPEVVADDQTDQGALRFGIPDMPLDPPVDPVRTIMPKVGRLVLFPSLVFHGTAPFQARDPRLTVAFDLVPKDA